MKINAYGTGWTYLADLQLPILKRAQLICYMKSQFVKALPVSWKCKSCSMWLSTHHFLSFPSSPSIYLSDEVRSQQGSTVECKGALLMYVASLLICIGLHAFYLRLTCQTFQFWRKAALSAACSNHQHFFHSCSINFCNKLTLEICILKQLVLFLLIVLAKRRLT